MQGISKPKTPVNFSFHNIPGKNFREKIQLTKYFIYFLCIFFNIVGIVLIFAAPISWEVIGALLFCFLLPPLMVWGITNSSNNYIFEEIEPGQYQSVLKGKGIGKLSKEKKLALLQKIFENKKEIENPVQVPQKSKAHVYAAILSLVIIVCLMYWAPITRKLICTHVRGTIYNCELRQKAVLRNLDTVNLGAITGAVVANKYDKHEDKTSDQIQFRTANNTNISYTQWWLTSLPFMLDRKVNALNKRFSKEEDFSYYLVNYVVVLGIIVLLFYPFIIYIVVRKGENEFDGDYFFSPKQYNAILRAEGLDNPNEIKFDNTLTTVEDEKIINHLKDDELTDMRKEFYDNTWSAKEQAKRDNEVEDLTKQFYDDGK